MRCLKHASNLSSQTRPRKSCCDGGACGLADVVRKSTRLAHTVVDCPAKFIVVNPNFATRFLILNTKFLVFNTNSSFYSHRLAAGHVADGVDDVNAVVPQCRCDGWHATVLRQRAQQRALVLWSAVCARSIRPRPLKAQAISQRYPWKPCCGGDCLCTYTQEHLVEGSGDDGRGTTLVDLYLITQRSLGHTHGNNWCGGGCSLVMHMNLTETSLEMKLRWDRSPAASPPAQRW